jgi:hypothetical protein
MNLSRNRLLAFAYAAAIFVGAFLLFQIQPLISKRLLPWFGGSAAVWTTCLLFFQTVLFAGYAYAHASNTWLKPRQQAMLHAALVVLALVLTRALPSEGWIPTGDEQPIPRILLILVVSIGLPYFVLAATGPLLQAWFARSFPGRVPYRLYALSNVGSLLALATYPAFFEPQFNLPAQAKLWTGGFVLYAVLCALIGWQIARLANEAPNSNQPAPILRKPKKTSPRREKRGGKTQEVADGAPFRWHYLAWLVLAAFGSVALMATTTHISTDIASVPLLWIVPLALYLITFIITFDRPSWYRRTLFAVIAIISIYATAMMHHLHAGAHSSLEGGTIGLVFAYFDDTSILIPRLQITAMHVLVANFTAMFAICMICHGELVQLRPAPRYLTSFYLMIAAGGALGGLFATVIAPHMFPANYEWDVMLAIACAVSFVIVLWACVAPASRNREHESRPSRYLWLGARVLLVFVLAAFVYIDLGEFLLSRSPDVRYRARNFFGTLTIQDLNANEEDVRRTSLANGFISHGTQFTTAARRREPTTYYAHQSGVGRAIEFYRRQLPAGMFRLGAVGLGTGTVAAYLEAGDSVTFYEINPAVIEIAQNTKWFTYLSDCRQRGAHCDIRLGDARLSLQRELAAGLRAASQPVAASGNARGGPPFHLLVLDAFTGDSIPVHLLTAEAIETYLACLTTASGKEGKVDSRGAIAVHISNRCLDLEPVVRALALRFKLTSLRINAAADLSNDIQYSEWILLTNNEALVRELSPSAAPPDTTKRPVLWTDARSSIFEILR